MSTAASTCLLFIQMTAKADQEQAFNIWHESDYIPACHVPGPAA